MWTACAALTLTDATLSSFMRRCCSAYDRLQSCTSSPTAAPKPVQVYLLVHAEKSQHADSHVCLRWHDICGKACGTRGVTPWQRCSMYRTFCRHRCMKASWQSWKACTHASKSQGLAAELERLRLRFGECQLEVEREKKRSEELLRVLASEEWAREAVASLFHTGTSNACACVSACRRVHATSRRFEAVKGGKRRF